MTSNLLGRQGRWSLPPQPPETWVGSTATLLLIIAAAVGLAVPGLVLLPEGGSDNILLAITYALGALFAVACAYLLVIQASVTQDRRLAWLAGGFVALWLLYLGRSLIPALPTRSADEADLRLAAALSLTWLLVLPIVALTAGLQRYSLWLLPTPLLATAAVGGLILQLPIVQANDVRVTDLGRALAVGAGTAGLLAALWWRRRAPDDNRGAWGWVGAALLLTTVVAVLRASSVGRYDPTSWASLVLEDVVLAVPMVGLYVISSQGYLRQARCWRRLESEVRMLRASSALIPGLSITPENEAGLPDRPDVVELVGRQDLQVALQVVVDLASGRAVGQEALARFGGRVPTDRWFRAAGLHGLGAELERVTLALALRRLETLPADQFLAINASPAALHDEEILRLLYAADLSRLVVEITEHDAVNDYAVTRDVLGLLRRSGARIAVDDVGAGFASLRHVLLLQPDVVKLDLSLTRDVHNSPRQQAIVRALVTFSDEVGATVLAEGIEVAEQVPALLEAGVTLGQGWHLGVPVVAC